MENFRFFVKVVLFLVFPMVLFGFPLWVLVFSGEMVPLSERINRQQSSTDEFLLTKSYYPFAQDLRRETFLYVRPQVTTLGNSRVYQIRQEFFNDDVTFYNTADFGVGIGHAFSEFWPLLEGGKEPEVVMVGLEQSLFIDSDEIKPPPESPHILYIIRRVYEDYRQGKFTIHGLLQAREHDPQSLGIQALITRSGTRKDGSERYGSVIENPHDLEYWDYAFKGTIERTEGGTHPLYRYAQDLAPSFLEELIAFLDEAQRREIHVVAFLPPYAPTVLEHMHAQGDSYAYLAKIMPAIQKEFQSRGFSVFDFTDATTLNAPDEEFLDGNHGSEKTYARMMVTMAQRDPVLRGYVDLDRLRRALESKNNLEVF